MNKTCSDVQVRRVVTIYFSHLSSVSPFVFAPHQRVHEKLRESYDLIFWNKSGSDVTEAVEGCVCGGACVCAVFFVAVFWVLREQSLSQTINDGNSPILLLMLNS